MTSATKPQTRLLISEAADTDSLPKWGEVRFHQQNELVLSVKGYSDKLVLRVNHSLILGRKVEDDDTNSPDVDLNGFDAFVHGVSRHHAAIEFADRVLTIRDLGSRNGTFLNTQRVAPHSRRILRDNDIIHLGNLQLLVRFHAASKN